MSLSGITLPLEIQTFLSLPCFFGVNFTFFFESSTLFQRLAILLVTSLLPPVFLPLVAADSETVSDMSCLAGADTCLWISILVPVRFPSFDWTLAKPWNPEDGLLTSPGLFDWVLPENPGNPEDGLLTKPG